METEGRKVEFPVEIALDEPCPNWGLDGYNGACCDIQKRWWDTDELIWTKKGYHLTEAGEALLDFIQTYLTPDARGGWYKDEDY